MYDSVESMFEKSGAVLNGHFLLASGRHSPVYWEKFQVLQFPEYTVALCTLFARFFRKYNVQLVAGPTTGGVILAFETARQPFHTSARGARDTEGRGIRRALPRPGQFQGL